MITLLNNIKTQRFVMCCHVVWFCLIFFQVLTPSFCKSPSCFSFLFLLLLCKSPSITISSSFYNSSSSFLIQSFFTCCHVVWFCSISLHVLTPSFCKPSSSSSFLFLLLLCKSPSSSYFFLFLVRLRFWSKVLLRVVKSFDFALSPYTFSPLSSANFPAASFFSLPCVNLQAVPISSSL